MDYKALGERIKKQRLKLKLTQERLAEKVGISESFLGHIERGDRKLSLETLVGIGKELNISFDYLLLDSISDQPDDLIVHITSILKKKDKKQAQKYIKFIKMLADNIDEWTE